jgi:hypothetical protein
VKYIGNTNARFSREHSRAHVAHGHALKKRSKRKQTNDAIRYWALK